MGNSMGRMQTTAYQRYVHPEVNPNPWDEPTFDSQLGFEGNRKERVMIATEAEMISAKIPLKRRDYCAHKLIEYRGCKRDNLPWVVNCHHEKHAYLNCQYDDMILRMKEFERERRLRVRQQKMLEV